MTENYHLLENLALSYPKDFTWPEVQNNGEVMTIVQFVTDDGNYGVIQSQYSQYLMRSSSAVHISYWSKDLNQSTSYNGKSSDVKISEDKRTMTIGDSFIKVEGEDEFKFTIHAVSDPDKLQYDLVFSGCPYGCVMDTQIPKEFCTENTKKLQYSVPFGKITGTSIVNGNTININGYAFFFHFSGVDIKKQMQSVNRRNFLYCYDGNDGVLINVMTGKVTENSASIILNNKLMGHSVDCEIEYLSSEVDPESKFEIPKEVKYTSRGIVFDTGKQFEISLVIKPTVLTESSDLLAAVPAPIRTIVKNIINFSPYLYRWLDEGEVSINLGDGVTKTIKGLVIQDLMFFRK